MKYGLHSVNLHTCSYPDDIPDKPLREAYAAAGVDRLILRPRPEMDVQALERFTADTGSALGLLR